MPRPHQSPNNQLTTESQSPAPVHAKSLTLFSWGYEGWGNAVPDLLAATERVDLPGTVVAEHAQP
jgi:hypothetical protein